MSGPVRYNQEVTSEVLAPHRCGSPTWRPAHPVRSHLQRDAGSTAGDALESDAVSGHQTLASNASVCVEARGRLARLLGSSESLEAWQAEPRGVLLLSEGVIALK
ncbi:hypothetical protein PR001_g4482 [Phytophthora rubi]|uniref:Uncharacterized protein n=1 Tax=Phytophthora rubi TaxID=129364 RepID=A0A6A3NZE7_9STRA|nr:hypothetical protein PR002_g6525 [Phytophthora rubi]KAE9046641.1 hypothetical protein PR001_g4482 [Phytophthora rubi]